jgi:hypothetical protein
MSPRDESAGPLLIEALHAQGTIPEQQFAILLGHSEVYPSSLTLGGYERDGGQMYDAGKYHLTSTRINGSFHWEFKTNSIGFMSKRFIPKTRIALTDTGTTKTMLPKEDWDMLFNIVCN